MSSAVFLFFSLICFFCCYIISSMSMVPVGGGSLGVEANDLRLLNLIDFLWWLLVGNFKLRILIESELALD